MFIIPMHFNANKLWCVYVCGGMKRAINSQQATQRIETIT